MRDQAVAALGRLHPVERRVAMLLTFVRAEADPLTRASAGHHLLHALGRTPDDGRTPTFRDVRTAMMSPDADVRERVLTGLGLGPP